MDLADGFLHGRKLSQCVSSYFYVGVVSLWLVIAFRIDFFAGSWVAGRTQASTFHIISSTSCICPCVEAVFANYSSGVGTCSHRLFFIARPLFVYRKKNFSQRAAQGLPVHYLIGRSVYYVMPVLVFSLDRLIARAVRDRFPQTRRLQKRASLA